jgi:uncharacterized protein
MVKSHPAMIQITRIQLCWILLIRKFMSLGAVVVVQFTANHPIVRNISTKNLLHRGHCGTTFDDSRYHKNVLAAGKGMLGGQVKSLTIVGLRGGFRTARNSSSELFDLKSRSSEPNWNNGYMLNYTFNAKTKNQNLTNTSEIIQHSQSDVVEREQSRTSLWEAAFTGSHTKLMDALAAGADVNARNHNFCRWGAIHYAVHHDDPHFLSILLDAGARVDLPCNLKVRALHLAAMNGSLRSLRFLLQAGACRDPPDRFGRTPLHYAAAAGQLKVVQVLLEAGADVNAQDCAAATPLAAAARCGHEVVAKLLLTRGGDASIEDRFGCTPAGIAVKKGYYSTAAACRTSIRQPRILLGHASSQVIGELDDTEDKFWQDEIL